MLRPTLLAAMVIATSAGHALAQPVLITAPQTLNPGATTITPTAGGPAVALETADITVRGTTLTVNGRYTIRSLIVENSGTVTHTAGFSFDYSGGKGADVVNGLWLNVVANPTGGDVSISANSAIDATARGFGAALGPGAGGSISGGSCAGGASHGGSGGNTSGPTYDQFDQPARHGSGGGNSGGQPGGAGGGVVRLVVDGALTVNGTIAANGGAPVGFGGGGAGGSISISAGVLDGAGSILANGATGNTCGNNGGGGGRVAIYADASTHSGLRRAAGRTTGGPGTLLLAVTGNPTQLIFDNLGTGGLTIITEPFTLAKNADVFVSGASTLEFNLATTDPAFTADNITIDTSSTVTHTAGNLNGLRLAARADLSVSANSAIDATRRGFGAALGPSPGGGISGGNCAAGGAHGGSGGSGAVASPAPYDAFANPTLLGSGGGNSGSQAGGPGGGLIHLAVDGVLTADGTIAANGGVPVGFGGGGAGGSIVINAAALAGAGPIVANGATGSTCGNNGGGGGRVAIYADAFSHTGLRQAAGRSTGGPGTVYLAVTGDRPELRYDNLGAAGITSIAQGLSNPGGLDLLVLGAAILDFDLATADPAIAVDTLTVAGNSTLTHRAGNANGLRIETLEATTVAVGSAINLDARGFAPATGPGAGIGISGGNCAGGGAHGGSGGLGSAGTGPTHDSFTDPTLLGSGGGNSGGQAGGRGGGALRLLVGGTLGAHGTISANGGAPVGFGGGGAGGSLSISAGTLDGAGSILANGATGSTCGNNGGGGGRVAIYADTFTHAGPRQAAGRATGGPGTVYLAVTGDRPELRYDNLGVAGGITVITQSLSNPEGLDLLVLGASILDFDLAIADPAIAVDTLTVAGSSTLTHRAGNANGLHIETLEAATIAAGSAINLDARGFAPATGPGAGIGISGGNCAGGGAHGGSGGLGSAGTGPTHDSFTDPTLLGSGGGNSGGQAGGRGGGALRLLVGGTLAADGSISANGGVPVGFGGGGAGGSIVINTAALVGAGPIVANGATGSSCGNNGGGGGRVAIYADAFSHTGVRETGGRAAGGPGTVLVHVTSQRPELRYDNLGALGVTLITTPLSHPEGLDLLLRAGAIITFNLSTSDPAIAADTLLVETGAVLTHTAANPNGLRIDVLEDMTVAAASAIDVSARGFGPAAGPGAGGNISGGNCAGGAGHGGTGAAGASSAGLIYDNLEQPAMLGSGGGNSGGQTGGPGGGLVRIRVDGALTVDGTISANGSQPVGFGGGGSGGSIWITADGVAGAGFILANAGGGSSCGNNGGGGGRIAIHSCTLGVPPANIRALRGSANAGDGTIYINPSALSTRFAGTIPECRGGSITMVAISASATSYQWLRNGVELVDGPSGFGSTISGSQTDTLTITNVQANDRGLYTVRVDNACGTVVSTPPLNLSLCIADFNCDGTVNSTDVSDFINQWFQDQVDGTLITDWDGNGVVNSTDVSSFINTWFEDTAAGCG